MWLMWCSDDFEPHRSQHDVQALHAHIVAVTAFSSTSLQDHDLLTKHLVTIAENGARYFYILPDIVGNATGIWLSPDKREIMHIPHKTPEYAYDSSIGKLCI